MDYAPFFGAAVGGMLGAVGMLVQGYVIQWYQSWRQDLSLKRDKLQELSDANEETLDWLRETYSITTADDLKCAQNIRGARAMVMLSSLFFPDLREPAIAYHKALREYYTFLSETEGEPDKNMSDEQESINSIQKEKRTGGSRSLFSCNQKARNFDKEKLEPLQKDLETALLKQAEKLAPR